MPPVGSKDVRRQGKKGSAGADRGGGYARRRHIELGNQMLAERILNVMARPRPPIGEALGHPSPFPRNLTPPPQEHKKQLKMIDLKVRTHPHARRRSYSKLWRSESSIFVLFHCGIDWAPAYVWFSR